MITIFRKIRQQLAAENNIPKYLRNAIGEIVLVVIGIIVNILNQQRILDTRFTGQLIEIDMEVHKTV